MNCTLFCILHYPALTFSKCMHADKHRPYCCPVPQIVNIVSSQQLSSKEIVPYISGSWYREYHSFLWYKESWKNTAPPVTGLPFSLSLALHARCTLYWKQFQVRHVSTSIYLVLFAQVTLNSSCLPPFRCIISLTDVGNAISVNQINRNDKERIHFLPHLNNSWQTVFLSANHFLLKSPSYCNGTKMPSSISSEGFIQDIALFTVTGQRLALQRFVIDYPQRMLAQ